jgi:uncharacterized protein DUF3592
VLDRPEPPDPIGDIAPTRASRGRRLAATVLLALGCVFTGLSLIVLYSCWWDDHSIDANPGRAKADVVSVSFNRAAVRFVTPDGAVVIPPNGVLYPVGLAAGERVWVEYDTRNPDVVRVAGRHYQLALLPVGSALAGAWVIVGPSVWWLRRKRVVSARTR